MERKAMVDKDSRPSIRRQCELLGVARNRLKAKERQESAENLELMHLLDQRHLEKPTHGVLRMQDFVREQGYAVSEKRVRRLLRKMGLEAIHPKRNLSKLGLVKYIHPYLLRNLSVERPNQVWATDITYIPPGDRQTLTKRTVWPGSLSFPQKSGFSTKEKRSKKENRVGNGK